MGPSKGTHTGNTGSSSTSTANGSIKHNQFFAAKVATVFAESRTRATSDHRTTARVVKTT